MLCSLALTRTSYYRNHRPGRTLSLATTLALTLSVLFFVLSPLSGQASTYTQHTGAGQTIDFPTVNPDYIYNQLYTMVTRYQYRESGYNHAGHDGFASYWAQEMVHNLQGFSPEVYKDAFSIHGWDGRKPTSDAFNVEVSVPGVTHPEQVVVIGCHYDGMAFSSQSANDDASGCAIELGVAQAMGNYWRTHHVAPARTLRFVIFDAEEQGIYGSFHYVNSTVNGDVQNIVAMFNEEQNGIAYPLRYLGQASNPTLPLNIMLSPLQNNQLYPAQEQLPPTQRDQITHFRTLMAQAVTPVFSAFQALGYQGLSYHGSDGQDHIQPIFTPDQTSNLHLQDDSTGGSDQIPFTLAGVPCATFLGNFSYYDDHPPAWSYPYDQPQDTIQLMNTFADGSSQQSHALTLALAIPGMLTTWMLHQPDILGEGTTSSEPVVTINDIGVSQVGKALTFQVSTSSPGTSYSWNFDDGTSANGATVSHMYKQTGAYQLTLTAHSSKGTRVISKMLNIVSQSVTYQNPYSGNEGNGEPPHNPQVILPTANNSLKDEVVGSIQGSTVTTTAGQSSQKTLSSLSSPLYLIAGIVLLILAVAASLGIVTYFTRKPKS